MTQVSNRKVQYFSGFFVSLGYLNAGANIAWVSPAIAKYRDGETDLDITPTQESWIASLLSITGILGCLGGQFLNNRIGRRNTMIASAIPSIIGAAIILLAKSAELLYLAKIIQGISLGITYSVSMLYLAEIADKEIRGSLGMLALVMNNIGFLIIYGIGPFVPYAALNAVLLTLPIVFLLAAFRIPESPYYYLMYERIDDARKVYMYIKGVKDEKAIEKQLSIIRTSVKENMENQSSMIELFTKKNYRKAIYVIAGLKIVQVFTGRWAIITYLQVIFKESHSVSGHVASIVYGFVQLGGCVAGVFLVRWIGRRSLMLASCLGVAISLTLLGLYFYLQNVVKVNPQTLIYISSLPLIGVMGFNLFHVIGIGTLPHVMQGELFPINVKTQASSAATIYACVLSFIQAKSYQNSAKSFGPHAVFWFFAAVAYLGIVFIYFCIPETKDKTLEEVQKQVQNNVALRGEVQPLKDDVECDFQNAETVL